MRRLAFLMLLAGCAAPNGTDPSGNGSPTSGSPLVLQVSADRTEVEAGKPINLFVTLRNDSRQRCRVVCYAGEAMFTDSFQLHIEHEGEERPGLIPEGYHEPSYDLTPSREDVLVLKRSRWKRERYPSGFTHLRPGVYTLWITFHAPSSAGVTGVDTTADPWDGTLTSNKVTITIR